MPNTPLYTKDATCEERKKALWANMVVLSPYLHSESKYNTAAGVWWGKDGDFTSKIKF